MSDGYLKISFAALLALSAPEPPPFFLLLDVLLDLLLDVLLDLPLDPFFEPPPAFSTNFLASFSIPAIRLKHAPLCCSS